MSTTPIEMRAGIVSIFEELGMNKFQAKDLEVGVYNASLDAAEKAKIPRNWGCPTFHQLYMANARRAYANLDSSSYVGNAQLMERLKGGEFPAHDIPWMKPDQLNPIFWANWIENEHKRRDAMTELKRGQETDMFTCGKCKKNKTSYYEMQTRSADEPMTIFVQCLTCGNRWKMG